MKDIELLKKEIEQIKERNKLVEKDKAWETSLFRKIVITVLTFFTVAIFFIFAGVQKPFLNAIVPSIAFIFSTLSLPFLKKLWSKKIDKNERY